MTRRHFGFTLIEVLVALSIVALSLTAIVASIGQMIDSGNAMRERTYASWIAQNRITELRISPTLPEIGNSNGTVEFANAEWTWRTVVAETGVPDLYRVDVSVSLAGDDNPLRTVTGFVSPPSPVGQANQLWIIPPRGVQGGDVRAPGAEQ